MAREVPLRHIQEVGLLLDAERIDARARIAGIPEEAPDLGRRIRGDRAILDQLVERLPNGSDDVSHEAPAPALSKQIGDEPANIVPRYGRHRLAAETREG
ncbi:MAG: hypothetical protein AUH99_10770 [Candidatus Rokubacteria bacterium 13_2_20CM_2_70_11]|nr:MAG: hypothetical protein AUH99_10770 [Candidatus Rokubacteria bacterium 13_2_20CM_2_70_11]